MLQPRKEEPDLVTQLRRARADFRRGKSECGGECEEFTTPMAQDGRHEAIQHFMMVGSGRSVPEHTGEFRIRRTPRFGDTPEEGDED